MSFYAFLIVLLETTAYHLRYNDKVYLKPDTFALELKLRFIVRLLYASQWKYINIILIGH